MRAVRDGNGTLIWPKSCQPGGLAEAFMFGAFEYIKLATYSVVPFIIILSLNVAIVAHLRHTTPMLRYSRHHAPSASGCEGIPLHRVGDTVIQRQSASANSRSESRQYSNFSTRSSNDLDNLSSAFLLLYVCTMNNIQAYV